jgi:hypothetical protein
MRLAYLDSELLRHSFDAPSMITPYLPSVPVLVRAHLLFLVEQVVTVISPVRADWSHNADLVDRIELYVYLWLLWTRPVHGSNGNTIARASS